MIKIGVLGSCVSRDNFYSKFIPNYKEYYECVFHQNQMSMISLVSNAIHVDNTKINNIKPFDKKHFITELDKSFWNTLIVNKPHYLIVDLYGDVRFGAIQVENTFITNKEFVFKKTDLYSQLNLGEKLNINDNPEKFFEAWKKSVDIFMRTLQRKLPNCKVIINKARFIDEYIDKKTNEVKK